MTNNINVHPSEIMTIYPEITNEESITMWCPEVAGKPCTNLSLSDCTASGIAESLSDDHVELVKSKT